MNFSLNNLTGFDLHNKTVGVIGTGKIGKVFIDICKGFGMNIIAYDPYPTLDNINYTDIDTICQQSDIISLHCPLTKDTKYIINSDTINKMKKGVYIGGAALDVYEEESDIFFEDKSHKIIDDDTLRILLSMPNVLLTSHQAFLTNEALENIADITLNNIFEYFEKNNIVNEVK